MQYALPNGLVTRAAVFGPQLCADRNLSAADSSIVDLLATLSEPDKPIAAQIQKLNSQIHCLQIIEKKNLPHLQQLQNLAALQKDAQRPFLQFRFVVENMHRSVQNNYGPVALTELSSLLDLLSARLDPQQNTMIDSVRAYLEQGTVDHLIVLSLHILQPNEDKMKEVLGLTFTKTAGDENTLSRLPYLSSDKVRDLKRHLDVLRLFVAEKLDNDKVQKLFFHYNDSITENAYAEFPEYALASDLTQCFSLAANFLVARTGLARHLAIASRSPMFDSELFTAKHHVRCLLSLTPLLGVQSTAELTRAAGAVDISLVISPRGYIQLMDSTFVELYWPLLWAGYSINEAISLSEEQFTRIVGRIPDMYIGMRMNQAFENLNRVKPQ